MQTTVRSESAGPQRFRRTPRPAAAALTLGVALLCSACADLPFMGKSSTTQPAPAPAPAPAVVAAPPPPPEPPREPVAAANASEPLEVPILGIKVDAVPASVSQAQGLAAGAGVLIVGMDPGGAAAKAGIKPVDVITHIAGQTIDSAVTAQEVLRHSRAGTRVPIRLRRGGKAMDVTVTLGRAGAAKKAPAKAAPATP